MSDILSENTKNMYRRQERKDFWRKLFKVMLECDTGVDGVITDEEMKKANDAFYEDTIKRAKILTEAVNDRFWKNGRPVGHLSFIEKDGVYSFVIAANVTRGDFEEIKKTFDETINTLGGQKNENI